MNRLVQIGVLALLGLAITFLHPFELVMPWQSGSPAPLDTTMQRIMAGDQYELVELNWGRLTPFNFVAMTARYRTNGGAATTCADLRRSLDDWGRVTDVTLHSDSCEIRARGPGPLTATIEVAMDADAWRELQIDIRVQHST
jgi:hypothetical protein